MLSQKSKTKCQILTTILQHYSVMRQKYLNPHFWCISGVFSYKDFNLMQSLLRFSEKKKILFTARIVLL